MHESLRIRGGSSQVFALGEGDRLTLYDLEGGQDALLYAFSPADALPSSHPAAPPGALADLIAANENAGPTRHRLAGHDLAAARGILVSGREAGAGEALSLSAAADMTLVLVVPSAPSTADAVTPADIDAHEDANRLRIVGRARLPIDLAEDSEIVAFRTDEMPGEHVALLIGQPDGNPPLVRLHSECLTGDVLGSLKCDCGPQLHGALHRIADASWGVLLYLRQEGRGIGLVNKLRAYRLQDEGFDTLEANRRLGLPDEARDFPVAARMLELLGVPAIRLMTNNPAKVAALEGAGVNVAERVPHRLPPNPHNARYLATKRDEAGHLL